MVGGGTLSIGTVPIADDPVPLPQPLHVRPTLSPESWLAVTADKVYQPICYDDRYATIADGSHQPTGPHNPTRAWAWSSPHHYYRQPTPLLQAAYGSL